MRPKFTTDKVLISGIALLLITIVFIIVISFFQSQQVNDTAKRVEHTQEVLLHSQKLLSAIIDNETGSRGYIITGQKAFLDPLEKSQGAIRQELGNLKNLTQKNVALQPVLDSLSYYADKRIAFSNTTVAVRDKSGSQTAMAMIETGEDKMYTDRLRLLIKNLQDTENELLAQRRQENENKIQTLNGILITVTITILILIGIFIQKTRKDFLEKKKNAEHLQKLNTELEEWVVERTEELQLSKNTLAETFERIDDGFIALDKNWQYTYVNKWAAKLTHRTAESLLGKNVWEEFPAAVGSATYNLFQKVMKEQVYECNTDYFEPLDLWQENHVYPAANGIVVFIRDITERKKAEQKIFKANRLYFFISQINQMIVRTTDEETLFTRACEIAVELGKFRMAWVGMIDERTKKVIPAKYAGEERGFLDKVKHMAFDETQMASPIAKALSEGHYVIFNDIEHDPQMATWKDDAMERGYLSLMALPITKFGKTIGVFSFYASEKNFFDEAEIALLLEATGDVSFALENFEKESLRAKAELEVVKSELRYHTLAEISPVGIFHADADGSTTYVNPRWCQISGLSFDEAMGFGWYKALHQQDRGIVKENWEKATINHEQSISEYRFVQPSGTVRWVIGQAITEKDNEGNVIGYVGTTTDITERKNAELELTESEEKYRVLFYHNPMPSWIIEKDGTTILDANDAALELYGYTREEFLALNVMQLRPKEEYEKYLQHAASMQQAPTEGNIGMWRHVKKDGALVDVELRAHSIAFNKLPCRMIMAIDITEQKKAEEEIRKSNERFELIARATSDVIWDWNLLNNHLWWNNNYYNLFGYDKLLTSPDISSWMGGIHPDDRDWVTKTLYDTIDSGKTSWTEEYRYFKSDGTTLYIYDRGFVMHDISGKPYRVIGSMLDVTERKKIEQAIRQSEEKYRTLVEQASDAIFIADTSGKFITVNSSAVKLSQYSEAELLEKNIFDFAVLEDLQKNPLHFQELRQGKSVTTERIMKRRDGSLSNVEVIGKLLSDGRLLVFVRDISERIKAQNEILKEKNLSDSIINSLPGIFYLYNKDGKFLRWNTNFETVSGYSHEEVSNMHPLDFFAEDEKELLLEKITNVFISGEENVQANFLTKSKEKIPFYFTGIAIEYEGSICLMGVGLDFSERIRAQEEIKETSEKLRQLTAHLLSIREEERKRIGREIHDELGQQLTAIKMDVSWIDKKLPVSTPLVKTKLKNIVELLDGSNHSIRRILSELRPAALDDYGLREALEWLNSQFTSNTGIPVFFDIKETVIKIPEEIATCIFRVYQEAFTNITRYAQAKNVYTSLLIKDNVVTVSIKDDGKGFDITYLKEKKSFGILGIKERIFSVGGKFELVSEPGKGTSITISIPFEF